MKLLVVLKMTGTGCQPDSYGSHYDPEHTKKCILNSSHFNDSDEVYISNFSLDRDDYYLNVLNRTPEIDTVVFGTMNPEIEKFIMNPLRKNLKIYTWFNGHWDLPNYNIKEFMDSVVAGFEQSNIVPNFQNLYHLPTGFHDDRNNLARPTENPEFDVMFSGTFFRNKRQISPHYRFDVLKHLLECGVSVLIYDGKGNDPSEFSYINHLRGIGEKIKVVNSWAEPVDYHRSKYVIHFPFHFSGGDTKGLGITRHETTVWFHNWDIFRAIGSGCNLITYESDEIRNLGLDESNCSFYKHTPADVRALSEDVFNIIKLGNDKKIISEKVSSLHSYQSRWDFILSKVKMNENIF